MGYVVEHRTGPRRPRVCLAKWCAGKKDRYGNAWGSSLRLYSGAKGKGKMLLVVSHLDNEMSEAAAADLAEKWAADNEVTLYWPNGYGEETP